MIRMMTLVLAASGLVLSFSLPSSASPSSSPGESSPTGTPGVILRTAQHAELIAGDLDKALKLYGQLVSDRSGVGRDAKLGLFRTLRKLGRPDEALTILADLRVSEFSGKASGPLPPQPPPWGSPRVDLPPVGPSRGTSRTTTFDRDWPFDRSRWIPGALDNDRFRAFFDDVAVRARARAVEAAARAEVAEARAEARARANDARATVRILKERGRDSVAVVTVRKEDAAAGTKVVSLTLKDVKIGEVARSLAEGANVKVVVTPVLAEKRVSISVLEVPPLRALDNLARAAGAALTDWNGTLALTTPSEASRMRLGERNGMLTLLTPSEAVRAQAGQSQAAMVTTTPLGHGQVVVATATPAILVALNVYAADERGAPRLLFSPRLLCRDNDGAQMKIGSQPSGSEGAVKSGAVSMEQLMASANSSPDLDMDILASTVKGTNRIRLKLDLSLSTTDRTSSPVSIKQWRRQAELVLKDGEPFRFDLAKGGKDSGYIEIQAFVIPASISNGVTK